MPAGLNAKLRVTLRVKQGGEIKYNHAQNMVAPWGVI